MAKDLLAESGIVAAYSLGLPSQMINDGLAFRAPKPGSTSYPKFIVS